MLLAGGAGAAILGVLALGLLVLRARTWWPFVGYCMGFVVLARTVEFAATRLEL